jgi:hypothetical protein
VGARTWHTPLNSGDRHHVITAPFDVRAVFRAGSLAHIDNGNIAP